MRCAGRRTAPARCARPRRPPRARPGRRPPHDRAGQAGGAGRRVERGEHQGREDAVRARGVGEDVEHGRRRHRPVGVREAHRRLALLPAHLDRDPRRVEHQQVEVCAARVVPVGGHGHLLGRGEVHELGDRRVDRAVGEGRPPFGRRDEMQKRGHGAQPSDRRGERPRRP